MLFKAKSWLFIWWIVTWCNMSTTCYSVALVIKPARSVGFSQIRKIPYQGPPSQLGPTKMYILEKTHFRDPNINARIFWKYEELPGATFICFALFTAFFGVFDQNLEPWKFHFCLGKRPNDWGSGKSKKETLPGMSPTTAMLIFFPKKA